MHHLCCSHIRITDSVFSFEVPRCPHPLRFSVGDGFPVPLFDYSIPKDKRKGAVAPKDNCSSNWNLLNLCWVVDNYLFTFSTMISSASRSCPIMRTQHDFFIARYVRNKPVLMCFGCEENLTSTLNYTTCHFVTTTRTFHTITLLCQIPVCWTNYKIIPYPCEVGMGWFYDSKSPMYL